MGDEVKTKLPSSGISIAGLCLGITSLLLFWVPIVHFIVMVLGVIFGSVAISRKQRFGVAGLATSLGSEVLAIGYFLVIIYISAATAYNMPV
jgi:hypothetical protein